MSNCSRQQLIIFNTGDRNIVPELANLVLVFTRSKPGYTKPYSTQANVHKANLLSTFVTVYFQATSAMGPSLQETNKAVVQKYFEEHWGKGNVNVVDEVCADNFVIYRRSRIFPSTPINFLKY